MLEELPEEIRSGLRAARLREARRAARLRLHVGVLVHPILRIWDGGLSLPAEAGPQLRGRVDVYEGSRHLFQALIVASSEESSEIVCAFKRLTPVSETPPSDYARDPEAPAGLLPRR